MWEKNRVFPFRNIPVLGCVEFRFKISGATPTTIFPSFVVFFHNGNVRHFSCCSCSCCCCCCCCCSCCSCRFDTQCYLLQLFIHVQYFTYSYERPKEWELIPESGPNMCVFVSVSVPLQITLGALCIMLLVRRILSNCWKIRLFRKTPRVFPCVMGS